MLMTPPPLLHGSDNLVEGYYDLEEQERRQALDTLGRHKEPIALWYRALTVYRRGMLGPMTLKPDDSEAEQLAHKLTYQLLGLGVGSAKASLDLLVVGYYSIAYGAIRHMFESAIQANYVAYHPEHAVLWYEHKPQPGELREPPKTKTMVAIIKKRSGKRDLWDRVDKSWELMSSLAHPSGEGINQTVSHELQRYVLGATYDKQLFGTGIYEGLHAVRILIAGLGLTKQHSEAWVAVQRTLSQEILDWQL
jgi:hypothetical protein